MEKKTLLNLGYVVFVILGVLLLQQNWLQMKAVEAIAYSEFLQYVRDGKVDKVVVTDQHLIGELSKPEGGKSEVVAKRVDPAVVEELQGGNVQIIGGVESHFLQDLLSWILPALVFFGLWMFLFRRFAERAAGGGLMSIGRNHAKVYVEKDIRVTFADVAGAREAKEELKEIVEFLKDPQRYSRLGAKVPKGVLLVGPPGTGKTLLARAVAGEAGVAFFSISGSEFVEMFVGVGAARVRDLFEQARSHAPAIIFIDELDALGRARNAYLGLGGHDEREQTLNQLLTELDGFDPREGVVLLAATNRPEVLDPALLRAGRFDRQILVDRPDKRDRIEIFNVHARKIRLAADVDAEQVAALTPGFTGADLANLVNEAALLATRRGAEAVTLADFNEAIERIVAGLEKRNRLLIPKEREIVAYHEMGHALTALALPGTDTVHKVSIIPRNIGALGYTVQRPTDDRYLMTRGELEDKIAVLLGGRAAEKLVFNHVSTGAADDLAKATDIARNMVTRFGMDESLGSLSFEADRPSLLGPPGGPTYLERRYSEVTAERIDAAVKCIIEEMLARTLAHLKTNRAVLEEGARKLLAQETLDETELRTLASSLRPADAGATDPRVPGAAALVGIAR